MSSSVDVSRFEEILVNSLRLWKYRDVGGEDGKAPNALPVYSKLQL